MQAILKPNQSLIYRPLQAWSRHWSLDNMTVRCRICGNGQMFMNPGAFTHAQDCEERRVYAQYPVRDLGRIIEDKIRAGCF